MTDQIFKNSGRKWFLWIVALTITLVSIGGVLTLHRWSNTNHRVVELLSQIEAMANNCRVLAVTEGLAGARLYWNGDLRRFYAPHVIEVDATGAGDIFAAAFFWRLHVTRDPWAAAKFATHLASFSVQRRGLEGIPTQAEIQTCLVEVL